jgi:glycosyltransferase involved in cell wall biosynthesis
MVFSAPSYYEAFHYGTLEAFAAGTPVVGSEAIPKQLLVDSFNGYRMSSPGEYRELARRCVELISCPEKWRNFSRNARATALKYDIGRTVSSYMTLV